MPKKSARKTRKVRRAAKKQSFLQRFFTFPKLAIGLFVILLLIFIYQVSLPADSVKGASTDSNFSTIQSLAQTSGSNKNAYVTYVDVFKDNGDAKQSPSEHCILGNHTFTVKSNGKSQTEYLDQQDQNCGDVLIQDNFNKCKTITIKPVKGYKVTGFSFKDGSTGNHAKAVKGSSTKELCGAAFWYYSGYNWIGFGLEKK